MQLSGLDSILKELDDDQKDAVTTTEKPLLVIAGPGSGKTRVITYRFAYIVLSGKASPQQILCVTFTNKAANEMKNRISKLTGVSLDETNWWIKTFHSLGLSIIKENYEELGLKKGFVVYDSEDQKRVVKAIMGKTLFGELSPERVSDIINNIRYGYDTYETFGDTIKEIVIEYEKTLRLNNAVDFTDLIILPYKLLKENENLRNSYKRRWKYIMVDEFQDTDPIQYELIKLLLNEERNICVVGDDDQSIYSWRGAKVENIRNFDKDFQDCKVVILKTNYRSTDEIIKLSNIIASNMLFRRDEKVIRGTGKRDKIPMFIETYEQRKEAKIVVDLIESFIKRGYKPKDIAVLYRVNYLSRLIEEELIKKKIPYKIYSGVAFYERAEVKDILAYLRFYINKNDFVSFSRIINIPKRGIGKATIEKILEYSLQNGKDLLQSLIELKEKLLITQEISDFTECMKILGEDEKLYERVRKLLKHIKYYAYLEQTYQNHEERIDNIEELIRAIQSFENEGGKTFEEFLEKVTLMTNTDEVDETKNYVSLMTLHVSKGLEFPIVFIFGAVDGIIPHLKNIHNQSLLDEERRLFYVGITRAKNILIITSNINTRLSGSRSLISSPSRFIDELPTNVIEILKI
ncbi:MAG: UvrD-helicase domain-containing protein [Brevinematales bacterium]|nr:UvrD-helicase domain-containing protein [Brevinematales bacterium]